jgi:hypothetical protein
VRAKGGARVISGREVARALDDLLKASDRDGGDEVLLGGEVMVHGARADAGAPGDLVKRESIHSDI